LASTSTFFSTSIASPTLEATPNAPHPAAVAAVAVTSIHAVQRATCGERAAWAKFDEVFMARM